MRVHARSVAALVVTVLLAGLTLLGAAPAPADPADPEPDNPSLTTTFESDNGLHGASFDVDVEGPRGIDVTHLDVNLVAGVTTGVSVWTRSGTAAGHETSPAGWVLQGRAVVTSAGTDLPTPVRVPFRLPTGVSGLAVVTDGDESGAEELRYTDGTGTYRTGEEGSGVELTSGQGLRTPAFVPGAAVGPRVVNTTLHFHEALDTDVTAEQDSPSDSRYLSFEVTTPPTSVQPSIECRLTGPDTGASHDWKTCGYRPSYSVDRDGTYLFEARARDGAGNRDRSPATREVVVDTVAPAVEVLSGPDGVVGSAPATFTFAGTPAADVVGLRCHLTGPVSSAPERCDSGRLTVSGLAPGVWTLWVVALDAAGNESTTPAQRSFEVDTVGPAVAVTDGPEGLTRTASPAFAYGPSHEGGEVPESYQCDLTPVEPGGQAGWAPCAPTGVSFSRLPEGDHTFSVRGLDARGNPSAEPATRAFTVDTVAPTVALTSRPDDSVREDTVTFRYRGVVRTTNPDGTTTTTPATEPLTFECSLDPVPAGGTAGWTSCPSSERSYQGLGNGSYTFSVRALDRAGNPSTPDTARFAVDAAAPDTTITGGPQGAGTEDSPVFRFTGEPGNDVAGYECRLGPADSAVPPDFESCLSGQGYPGLADGDYLFEVRAVDPVGNVDATPASRAFTVDTTAPPTTITAGPAPGSTVTSTSVTFTYAGDATGDTFRCVLRRGSVIGPKEFLPCPAAGRTYTDLLEGPWEFSVIATDAVGNSRAASVAVRSFTVNTVAPTIRATLDSAAGPTLGWFRAPVQITYTCTDGGSPLTTGTCPRPRTVSTDGANQVVTQGIATADGDTASVTTLVSIDRVPPRLQITGFDGRRTYTRAPVTRCVGSDALSGLHSCRTTVSYNRARTRVFVLGRAVDRAGNQRVLQLSAPFRRR